MRGAVKHAFHRIDEEILSRARDEKGRDGACALVVLRIGAHSLSCPGGNSRQSAINLRQTQVSNAQLTTDANGMP